MTNQEVFEKVSAHLLAQQEVCMDDDGHCRYRNDDGLKCAIGCLIPDELYKVSMEGQGIEELIQHNWVIRELFEGVNSGLLGELQAIHDCTNSADWLLKLAELCQRLPQFEPNDPEYGAQE